MERLQIAIEKARAQRQGATVPASAPALSEPAVEPAPEDRTDDAPSPAGVEAAWDRLARFELSEKTLKRNRIITFDPGPDSMTFDQLRTRIVQQARHSKLRRIALVSAHTGAGKSTTLANLAFCFARQSDLRTLVIDFDLRRPNLGKILGQTPNKTMADVISGETDFAAHALRYGGNLAFGLNREGVRNASEILQSRRAARLLDEIEATYAPDLMLFDMPPILAADDAIGFLRQVDAALLVVEAERTPVSQIEAVEEQIAGVTQLLGLVLNRCSYRERASEQYGYN